MKKIISKYFWSLNERALNETVRILKNPSHPRFREKVIAVMSLCDTPAEFFRIVPREVFIAEWPSIRRKWKRVNRSLDFLHWWEAIYKTMVEDKAKAQLNESSRHFMTIGEQVKAARLQKDWSQEDLAGRVNMDQRKVSAIESGKANVTLETLLKVAKVLGIKRLELGL